MAEKILVVEDEKDVQDLIERILTREGYSCVIVGTGTEAETHLSQEGYQLAIIDWMLPGLTGIELCQKFRGRIPLLMVTAREDPTDIVRGLDAGADDYLTKPFSLPVLAARVRALLRRQEWLNKEKSNKNNLKNDPIILGNLKLDAAGARVFCEEKEIQMTAGEFKILNALLENQGKVLSRSTILKLSHDENVHVVERVVDTQLYQLRKKLGPCGDLFETVRGIGYRVRSS